MKNERIDECMNERVGHYTNRRKKNQGNPYRKAAKVLNNRRHDAFIKGKNKQNEKLSY